MDDAKNQLQTEIEIVKEDSQKIDKTIKTMQIETDEDYKKASEFLGEIKKQIKKIEEARLSVTKPINESLAILNQTANMAKEPLQKLEALLKDKMKEFLIEQEKKIAEEEKRRQEEEEERKKKEKEALKKGEELPPAPIDFGPPQAPESTTRTQSGTSSAAKVWKFNITEPTKVPIEYWEISESKIRQAIRDGKRKIPGIKIYQDTQIKMRSL